MAVTGCDTRLDQRTALRPAQAGCNIVDINIIEPTETIEQVVVLGRHFLSLTADLRKIDGVPALLDCVVAESDHIDILVNNVGSTRHEDAFEFSEKDWDDVMNLNIKSALLVSQAAAKHLIAQGSGGKTINIAPMLSFQDGVRVPSYTASKSGTMDVARLMVGEWAKHNINVNAITPGYITTNNTQRLRTDEQRDTEVLDCVPAGRRGLLNDLMGPVVFLASSASDYVSGHTIAVGGGWLVR